MDDDDVQESEPIPYKPKLWEEFAAVFACIVFALVLLLLAQIFKL